jgi:DNA-3-methyladenine glycosylase II
MKYDSKPFQKGKRHLAKDPSLKALFARHRKLAFSPGLERSPFESLVRAIAHQQLHGKAAETILGRMLDLFPGKPFPSADDLASLPDEKLRACGYSASKTKSIKDIAAHTQLGVVPSSAEIEKLSNQEIIERLTKIFGVGKWTVEMLLIFQLGRLDVWPVDDFGVRKGFQVWKKKRQMPTAKDLKKIEKKFAPYQTIVSLYLWREADLAKIKK